MAVVSREVHLVARPNGMPREEEFAIVDNAVPDAGDGEIQVRKLYLSIFPTIRPRLSAEQPLNEPLRGMAIGRATFAIGHLEIGATDLIFSHEKQKDS
jgi:NADPH-dependent curcumin reductase CurA